MADSTEHSVLTRRALMVGAAGAAVAGVGVAAAGPAAAETPRALPESTPAITVPTDVVAVLRAGSGVLDVYFAEQHVQVSNRQLADLIARAAH
jgi:hypothetical protein